MECERTGCPNKAAVRFCSISCSNRVIKKKTPFRKCKECGKESGRLARCRECKRHPKPFEMITNNQGRKIRLVAERGWKCEGRCGLGEWFGEPIPLEVDHIDGDHTNTKKENFRLLCPNCHVFTPTYKGRNGLRKYCRRST